MQCLPQSYQTIKSIIFNNGHKSLKRHKIVDFDDINLKPGEQVRGKLFCQLLVGI